MERSIYITTTESHCGKSLISLGITEMMLRKSSRVAVFRPIIGETPDDGRDKNIDLLLNHFRLDIPYEDTFAYTTPQAADLLAHRRFDALISGIIQKYMALKDTYDIIVCIGSDLESQGAAFEFDVNVEIAQSLGTPVLLVSSIAARSLDDLIGPIHMALNSFKVKGCQIVGTIVNRAPPEQVATILTTLQQELADETPFVAVIPANDILASPTVREIAEELHADVLYGHELLDRQAFRFMIIAMQMQNYLTRLSDNALLVTPGDRGEIILSALEAHRSVNYPPLAGIVLTTGERPAFAVQRLLDGLPPILPILAVDSETFETATNISNVRSYITAENQAKVTLSLKLFKEFVDVDALETHLGTMAARGIPPRMFLYNLVKQAKTLRRHIVLPEGNDERILRAAEYLLDQDIVDLTLIGDADEVKALARQYGLQIDFKRTRVLTPRTSPHFDDYVNTFYELRKDRGVNMDMAIDLMQDVSYYGTMMVFKGDADGMVSGAAHTTAHTIRPAFQFVKTRPGYSVVSSVFFMCLDDRVLVYGDCAVNPKPTAEELAEIAIASAETAELFGVEPRVAMLSYSSGASGTGEEVERVRTATKLAHERRPDLLLEGPIQYDAAVDMDVARSKMPGSQVAGRASVLIFPDLNTGNNTYKAVQRETGAIAIGPVLQGLRKPINDLSRGCTVEDVINTVVITAIQAQGQDV